LGHSNKAIINEIKRKSPLHTPNTNKITCPLYKPARKVTDLKPDFYIHASDRWLVFPHELCGLTPQEILHGKGSEIADTIARATDSKDYPGNL